MDRVGPLWYDYVNWIGSSQVDMLYCATNYYSACELCGSMSQHDKKDLT
jgi:hypothetical protein